jgi:hypothetical protein
MEYFKQKKQISLLLLFIFLLFNSKEYAWNQSKSATNKNIFDYINTKQIRVGEKILDYKISGNAYKILNEKENKIYLAYPMDNLNLQLKDERDWPLLLGSWLVIDEKGNIPSVETYYIIAKTANLLRSSSNLITATKNECEKFKSDFAILSGTDFALDILREAIKWETTALLILAGWGIAKAHVVPQAKHFLIPQIYKIMDFNIVATGLPIWNTLPIFGFSLFGMSIPVLTSFFTDPYPELPSFSDDFIFIIDNNHLAQEALENLFKKLAAEKISKTQINDRVFKNIMWNLYKESYEELEQLIPAIEKFEEDHVNADRIYRVHNSQEIINKYIELKSTIHASIFALNHYYGGGDAAKSAIHFLLRNIVSPMSEGLITLDATNIIEQLQIAPEGVKEFFRQYTNHWDFLNNLYNYGVERSCNEFLNDLGIKVTISTGTGLALIIDSTGSMSNNDPHNARIYAGELVIDQAEDDWKIGIVDFDTSSKLLASGLAQDQSLRSALAQIDSEGLTNIQIGLEEGFHFLEITNKEIKGAILLTDGDHNRPSNVFDYSKYVDIFTQKGWPVYTIGLTGDANEVLLSKIASMTGGAYLKADSYQDMLGLIDLILSQFKHEGIIAYLKSKIKSGETAVLDFPVDNSVKNMQQRNSYPGSKIEFSLIDPQGREISATDLSQGIEVIEGKAYKIIKVKNPMPGIWKAKAVGIEVSGGEEPYEIKISADTPIRVETKGAKPVYDPFEPIEFKVNITGDVDQSSLSSLAKVTTPEGNQEKISLKQNQVIKYPKTGKPGVYYFNIEVKGKKNDGEQFMREGLKHIVVASSDKEFGVGNIIKIWGSYLEIDMGKEIGLSEGKKIFIYTISGGIKKKIAEGYVTSVFQGKSIVELTATWGSEIPQVGKRAEIDRSEF